MIKKQIKIIALLLILGVYIGFWHLCIKDAFTNTTRLIKEISTQSDQPLGPILSGDVYRQSFLVNGRLSGVSLKFATYSDIKHCNVTVKVIDTNYDTVIFAEEVQASTLEDNQFKNFYFDIQDNDAIKEYAIEITSDADTPENAITTWTSNGVIDGTMLTKGENVIEQTICSKIFYQVPTYELTILKKHSMIETSLEAVASREVSIYANRNFSR